MASDITSDKAPAGVFEHRCEHPGCLAWGGFGYAPSKSAPMQWWCARHYTYWTGDMKAKYAALAADGGAAEQIASADPSGMVLRKDR